MSIPIPDRYFLTILIWALILELIVFAYYIPRREFSLELMLTFAIFLITITGIALIIRRVRHEVKYSY